MAAHSAPEGDVLCCVVLCCVVLCCVVLCCVVLCCVVLCCVVLCCVVLCCVVLCCVVLCCVVLCCVVLCRRCCYHKAMAGMSTHGYTGKQEGCVSYCAMCGSVLLYSRDQCTVALGRCCSANACAQSNRV